MSCLRHESDRITICHDITAYLTTYLVKIRSPSLTELHALVAVAELGSLVRAAEQLEVSQGAITRAIQRLEAHLGETMFDRHRRGSSLTPIGQSYADAVAPLLRGLEQATLSVQGLAEEDLLRVAIIPTIASEWLIRRLPEFQLAHPEVRLQFVPYHRDWSHAFEGVDVSIRGGDGSAPKGFECDYLLGKPIVPVRKPVRGVAPLQAPIEVLTQPLLYHTSQPDAWNIWAEAMGCGGHGLKLSYGFDQVTQLLEAALAGLGTAIVQRCFLDGHLEAGRLEIAWPQAVTNRRGYYLFYPSDRRFRHSLRVFRAWLCKQAEASEPASPTG